MGAMRLGGLSGSNRRCFARPRRQQQDFSGHRRDVDVVHGRAAFHLIEAWPLRIRFHSGPAGQQFPQYRHHFHGMISQVFDLKLSFVSHHHRSLRASLACYYATSGGKVAQVLVFLSGGVHAGLDARAGGKIPVCLLASYKRLLLTKHLRSTAELCHSATLEECSSC